MLENKLERFFVKNNETAELLGSLFSGQLLKRADWTQEWNSRHIFLKDAVLHSYKSLDDAAREGELTLTSESTVKLVEALDHPHSFEVIASGSITAKRWLFAADSQALRDTWVGHISGTIDDMKLHFVSLFADFFSLFAPIHLRPTLLSLPR